MQKSRHLWLVDAERVCDLSLSESLAFDNPIEGGAKPGLGVEFGRVWQTQVGKDISTAEG